jgi:site-specific recombinase XerD
MIGALLGHSQVSTTARYAHLANDPLKKVNDDAGNIAAKALGANVYKST